MTGTGEKERESKKCVRAYTKISYILLHDECRQHRQSRACEGAVSEFGAGGNLEEVSQAVQLRPQGEPFRGPFRLKVSRWDVHSVQQLKDRRDCRPRRRAGADSESELLIDRRGCRR